MSYLFPVLRFALHYAEMWIAMLLGMLAFMAVPGVMQLPRPVHLLGMAVAMSAPMIVWMRIRGHGWRHGFEMAAAMLAPWAAVLGLVAGGAAAAAPWLAEADTPAMGLGMLGFMLVRRGHGAAGAHQHAPEAAHRPTRHLPWRRVLLVTAYVGAIVLAPGILGSVTLATKFATDAVEPIQPPTYAGALPAPPVPDPAKKIAVVVSGPRGVEIGDAMEAFETLARSDVFNVYVVAPERTPVSLNPGPMYGGSSIDVVPHFSFASYDAQIGRAPDLIAIPWFEGGYSPTGDVATLDWIRSHFGQHTTLLGICSGNIILADTGLVAGRTATTNTGTFDRVAAASPTTTWLHDLRYVDDGNIVTTSNLTSGIAGALHVVDREAGRAKALDVARQIGYTLTSALDDPRFDPTDDAMTPRLLDAALAGPKEQLGVVLYDGVTELGLSGIVDPFVGSFSARTYAMAPERGIIRSLHGLDLVPRFSFGSVPRLDRVVVPAGENTLAKQQAATAWSAFAPDLPAVDLYGRVGQGESAYDVSFRDLAQTRHRFLAQHMANVLFYPADVAQVPGAGWPLREALALLGAMLAGAGVVYLATHLRLAQGWRRTWAGEYRERHHDATATDHDRRRVGGSSRTIGRPLPAGARRLPEWRHPR